MTFLRRFWPYLAGAAAIIAIIIGVRFYISHIEHVARAEQFAADKLILDKQTADIRAKTAAAQIADQQHALAVAAARTQGTKDANNANVKTLAELRGRLAAYVVRHPASGAAEGGGGIAGVSSAAGGPVRSNRSSGDAVVPVADLDACAVAVGRLQTIKDWWAGVEAGPQ